MNFWSSESNQACLNCRVVTKVNEVKSEESATALSKLFSYLLPLTSKNKQKGDQFIAPVGENWWTYKESWPNLEMYDEDGAHASYAGSDFAAKLIWETILDDLHRKEVRP